MAARAGRSPATKVWGLSGFHWNTPISIAAWVMGLAQIPFIINFFWSMRRGEKVGRQSLGSDHPGMDGALAAAARQFHRRAGGLSRTLRIQPAGPGEGFHDANRTGPAERTRAARTDHVAQPLGARCSPNDFTNGNSLHRHRPARYRPLERQGRHLALPRFGSDALRRSLFRLHFPPARCRAGLLAARPAQRAGRHNEHGDPDRLIGHGGAGVGLAQDAATSTRYKIYMAITILCGVHLSRGQAGLRMAAKIRSLRRVH